MDYAERLTVPLRWWVQATMLVASFWLALVVALPGAVAWVLTGVVMVLVTAALLAYGAARVAVGEGHLSAGRARIPVELVGEVTPLDAEGMRRLAGPDADARAFLLIRPYLKRGVRVDIADPADPTPYWLIGCRRPERVAAAIRGHAVSG